MHHFLFSRNRLESSGNIFLVIKCRFDSTADIFGDIFGDRVEFERFNVVLIVVIIVHPLVKLKLALCPWLYIYGGRCCYVRGNLFLTAIFASVRTF